jgi:plastocyanin
MNKKLLASIGVTAAAAAAALAVPALAAGPTVRVDDNFFKAKTLRIKPNTTVRWRWAGEHPHNVKFRSFHSTTKTSGTYRHRFTKRGTYHYVCTIHDGKGMKGTVIVR